MFVDDVTFTVKAGDGGNGCVSFRHEKYVDKGGPYGGDGGRGGNIIFVGDSGMTTLVDFKFKKQIVARSGEKGQTKNCFGAKADDVYIHVPLGSIIYDLDKDAVIADITKPNEEQIIAKGGKGGRGNSSFANSRIPSPQFAENGVPGEFKNIRVELRILADVGLIGFPSVGKSTLIASVSACKPKIADYPFTTLVPNMGVVQVKNGKSFVMADMPGLIEGASSGAGLGIEFLKHIQRTRVLVHIVDMATLEGRDPYEDYIKIRKELEDYDPRLLERQEIIVASKMDAPESQENLEKFQKHMGNKKIIPISAYTKLNIDKLLYEISDALENVKIDQFEENSQDEVVEYKYTKPEPPFTIEKTEEGLYNVVGPEIKRIFDATDFERDASVKLFARKLRVMGVDAKLEALGVEARDIVLVMGYEFEFFV